MLDLYYSSHLIYLINEDLTNYLLISRFSDK